MACLEICNNTTSNPAATAKPTATFFSSAPPMGHRISFSNDFAESSTANKLPLNLAARAPASFDFEFSVSGSSMVISEELIFKGQMLPFKNTSGSGGGRKTTTLREELLAGDEDVGSKGSVATKWKCLLRKAHIGAKTTSVGAKLPESVSAVAVYQPQCLLLP